jgi:DNA-binding beta-propeller fold protein YncE
MNPLKNDRDRKKTRLVRRIIHAAFAVVILAMATLTVNGAPGDLFASINGGPGNGAGFIYRYTRDGAQSLFASGLSRPRGLAFDSAGNLFVATNFCDDATWCHPTILKITPGGTQNAFATIPDSFFAQGVAIDRSDNVYVMAIGWSNTVSIIFKLTPEGGRRSFGFVPGHGFGLAFDSAGNLFAADVTGQTIYKFTPDGTRSIFVGPEAFTNAETGPIGLAFDHFGNLFVSTLVFPYNNDRILKFTPHGVKRTFASGLPSPRGLIFDSAGKLFVADIPPSLGGDILKFTRDGVPSVFASEIGVPQENGGPEYLVIQPARQDVLQRCPTNERMSKWPITANKTPVHFTTL